MASTTIKATYSLDQQTVRILGQLARRWGVSKSEALRRSIMGALTAPAGVAEGAGALAALDQLQRRAALKPTRATKWVTEVRAQRRAHGKRVP